MKDNVIDLMPHIEDRRPFEGLHEGAIVVDMYASHEVLKRAVDELWNHIYCDEEIIDLHADDDGKVYYRVSEEKINYTKSDLHQHVLFMMGFINRNCSTSKFMEEYSAFAEEASVECMISFPK